MTGPLACVMCMVDPRAGSLIAPLAQATVIVVPFIFRREVSAAVRRVRARTRPPIAPDAVEIPKDQGSGR